MVPEGSMAGNRLVFLALALLAACGRDKGGSKVTDNPNRDLQRPAVDASSPLNDRRQAPRRPAKTGTVAKGTQDHVLDSGDRNGHPGPVR